MNYKLQEIIESDNNGNSYNSMYIVWDEKTYGESDLAIEEISQFSAAADVNNDGKSDIFSIDNNTISLYISDFDNFDEFNFSNISISGAVTNVFSIDDNSGKEDILVVSAYQNTYYAYRFVYNVVNELFNYTCVATCSSATQNPLELFMGDFTGNGEHEMYWVDIVTGNVICSDFIPVQDFPNNQIINSYESQPVDFSGNGKTDLFAFTAYPAKVYVYEYGTTFQQTDVLDLPNPSTRGYHTGDFNGDGKTDMLMFYNNNTYVIHLSTGRKLLNEPMEVAAPGINYWADQNIIAVRDFTGDGIDDLLMLEVTQIDALRYNHTYRVFSLKYHYLEHNNGDFPFAEFVETNTVELQNVQTSEPVLFGDFNGDCKYDIFMEYQGFTGTIIEPVPFSFAGVLYMNENNREMFVQSVYDGFNSFVEFDYVSIANDKDYSAQSQTSPFFRFNKPFWVVKSTSVPNNQDVLVTHYTYSNGVSHKNLGFLGFENATVISPQNIENEAIYDYSVVTSNNNNHLLISEVSSQVSDMNQPVLLYSSDIENSYIFYNNGKTILQTIESETNYDYVKGNKIVSEIEYYTAGGNPDNITTYFYEINNGTPAHTSLQEYTYTTFGTWHVPSRVSAVTTTQTRQGQQSYIREATYSYDSYGRMTQSVLDPGKSGALTKTYSNFTVHGLPRSVSLSGGSLSRTASVDYDSKGRFVVSETNPMQQTKTQTWSEAWGAVVEETAVNGLDSWATYDSFGRLISFVNELGDNDTIYFGWADEVNPLTGARYWMKSEKEAAPYVQIWFDMNQRKLREQTQSYIGVVFSDFQYDAYGYLYRTCLPTSNITYAKWTEYSYDVLGRIVDEQHQDLDPTTYTYYNNTVTVTDPAGRQRTLTYDPTGMVIEADEPLSGNVTYTYNSMNKPVSVVSNGTTITTVWDEYGRQTQMTDPNTGTFQFSYNSLNELISYIDEKSCTTSYQYNALGAVTQITATEGTTTYTYNTSGVSVNQPSAVQGPQATFNFTYDTKGRIASRQMLIPSENDTLTEQYQWDSYSRLYKFTYPSGFAIKYEYTGTGYLNAIKKFSDNSLIWQAVNRNEMNLPVSNMLGNGVEEKFSWDQYYQLTRLRYQYSSGSSMSMTGGETGSTIESITTYFDMSYSMNPETGNLNSRTNNIRSLTETFTYDNLDRLINAQVGSTNYPVSYLTNGNIDEKFDAGEYAYDNSNHAVTDITGTGSAIPTNTQSITYNSFNKPTSVSQGYRNSQFKYSPDMQRCVMKTYNTQVFPAVWINTRYYLGNYEELVVKGLKSSKKYHYIYSPDGLAAIYYTYGTTTAMYYAAKDHLGSICMLIDQNRSVITERSYDAWGRLRNYTNWTDYTTNTTLSITNRGYTIHEHLTGYGIVNMNGRLYDPIVGRMFNADPFIANPNSSQDYNRYSYVRNNPLRYTDPSGYFISGGWGYWDRKLKANTSALYGDRDSWNNHLDYIYGRGAFAAGGGFGGTTAFYGVGGSCLGIGSVGSGMLDDDFVASPYLINLIEKYEGIQLKKRNNEWGYWQDMTFVMDFTDPLSSFTKVAVKYSKWNTVNSVFERTKYGHVVGGTNVQFSGSLGGGVSVELGYLFSSNGWQQPYVTLYASASNASAGISYNSTIILAKQKVYFSDFNGECWEAGGSSWGSIQIGGDGSFQIGGNMNNEFTILSIGAGFGSMDFSIGVLSGHTILIGNPTPMMYSNSYDFSSNFWAFYLSF